MFEFLNQYTNCGHFILHQSDELKEVCNAPKNKSGVYLLYADVVNTNRLIYIGCSGLEKDGKIQLRKGGIYDRLVNGKQFNEARRKSLINKIKENSWNNIHVKWWDTETDFPEVVEACLILEYEMQFNKLPIWNKSDMIKESLEKAFIEYITRNHLFRN